MLDVDIAAGCSDAARLLHTNYIQLLSREEGIERVSQFAAPRKLLQLYTRPHAGVRGTKQAANGGVKTS